MLYASGTNGHRLRSTMSLPSGGVVASFSKPGLEDLHLLDVHPWTSVTMDSAMSMVQELGRASSFFAKKLPKNVIFAGHLADNAPTVQKRQRGFLRTFSKPSEDQFKPQPKQDCGIAPTNSRHPCLQPIEAAHRNRPRASLFLGQQECLRKFAPTQCIPRRPNISVWQL